SHGTTPGAVESVGGSRIAPRHPGPRRPGRRVGPAPLPVRDDRGAPGQVEGGAGKAPYPVQRQIPGRRLVGRGDQRARARARRRRVPRPQAGREGSSTGDPPYAVRAPPEGSPERGGRRDEGPQERGQAAPRRHRDLSGPDRERAEEGTRVPGALPRLREYP